MQTVIEALTVNYLNDNRLASDYVAKAYGFIPLTASQVEERMEARASGALLGFGLGSFGRTSIRSKRDLKIDADDLRELDDQLARTDVTVTVDGQPVPTQGTPTQWTGVPQPYIGRPAETTVTVGGEPAISGGIPSQDLLLPRNWTMPEL